MTTANPLARASAPATSAAQPRTPFLLERVRGGLWLAVLATAFFAVADFFIAPGDLARLYAVKLVLVAGVAVAFAILLQILMDDATDWPPAAFSRRYGITLGLYMPISRAGQIVGGHTAGFRSRREALSGRRGAGAHVRRVGPQFCHLARRRGA
jgi:hypothetical protein